MGSGSWGFWKAAGVTALVIAVSLRKHFKPWLVNVKLSIVRYVMEKTIRSLTEKDKNLTCEVGIEKVAYNDSKEVIEYRTFVNAPKTLHELYLRSKPFKDSDFIVYTGKPGVSSSRKTFGRVLEESAILRYVLKEQFACVKGDRVSILMSNIPEFALSFVAATSLGSIAVTLNAFWEGSMIDFGLRDSGTKVLIADCKRLERLLVEKNGKTLLQTLIDQGLRIIAVDAANHSVFKHDKNIHDFQSVLDKQLKSFENSKEFESDKAMTSKVNTDDDAIIMYTSGTTSGKPKGVVLTHRAMTQTVYCFVLFCEVIKKLRGPSKIQRSDLITSPLFHAASLSSAFLFAFTQGNKLVMMPRWDPKQAATVFVEEKITYCGLMPTMLSDLVGSDTFAKNKEKFVLTNVGTGGAHCPSGLIQKIFQELPSVSQGSGWGLTESNSVGTAIGGPEYMHNPLSCGRPHCINDVKIVDPESGKEITECDQPGELWIKSVTRMRCYWNRPDATEEAVTPDGWLRTGDIGKRDKNGLFYIVDRLKDLIIRGGENISCAEIEDAIYEVSNKIREVCVFGLSDKRLGEQVCAVIHVEGNSDIEPNDVKTFLAGKLARHKVPAKVFFSSTPLPRGGTGKFLKRQMKEMYKEHAT